MVSIYSELSSGSIQPLLEPTVPTNINDIIKT